MDDIGGGMHVVPIERFQETVNALHVPNVIRFECDLTR